MMRVICANCFCAVCVPGQDNKPGRLSSGFSANINAHFEQVIDRAIICVHFLRHFAASAGNIYELSLVHVHLYISNQTACSTILFKRFSRCVGAGKDKTSIFIGCGVGLKCIIVFNFIWPSSCAQSAGCLFVWSIMWWGTFWDGDGDGALN